MVGKAGNLGGGEGGWGTINLTSRIRRRWKCSPSVLFVSEEWWVVNTEASLCQKLWGVNDNKSWWACSRLSDSGEWHFPPSERVKQAKSWKAIKMIEQKEALLLVMKTKLYKDRTSVYCWLVWSKPQAPCLLKMRKNALLQRSGEICKSINISKIHIFSRLV